MKKQYGNTYVDLSKAEAAYVEEDLPSGIMLILSSGEPVVVSEEHKDEFLKDWMAYPGFVFRDLDPDKGCSKPERKGS